MAQGTVKAVTGKGYGFISTDESDSDVFYHESDLPMGVRLNVGDAVEFDLVETDKGMNAENIRVTE